MIVIAFAHGDRRTLKDLLSKEVYEGFDRAIAERESRGEKVETTFVSIDKAEIAGVEVRGRMPRSPALPVEAHHRDPRRLRQGRRRQPRSRRRRDRRVDFRADPGQPRPQLAARRDRSGEMTRAGASLAAPSRSEPPHDCHRSVPPLRVCDARLEPLAFARLRRLGLRTTTRPPSMPFADLAASHRRPFPLPPRPAADADLPRCAAWARPRAPTSRRRRRGVLRSPFQPFGCPAHRARGF